METEDGKKSKNPLLSKKKRRIIALAASLTGLGLSSLTVLGAVELYDSFFKRYERPDYSLVAGQYCYERVMDILPREEIYFYSDGVKLTGYYYEVPESNGLIVVSHGIHAGADDYLPAILYFYRHGYSVFSYNYKGTYDSEGEGTVGMSESLVDLDHAIDFLQSDGRFKNMPLYLFGHSWGGFASASVLSLKTDIKAVACVAPFYDGYKLILQKGYQYAGEFGNAGKIPEAFLGVYQKILFKDYVNYNAVTGLNNTNIPVFIAHGVDDAIISYNQQSVSSQKGKIANPNVQYYVGRGLNGGHDSIWHSARSVEYQQEVEEQIKEAKKQKGKSFCDDDLREIYKGVNHELYSEVNEELFDEILGMFGKAK